MGYYIDLKSISIDKYKDIIKSAELIPSWKVLKENIDENLNIIKAHNIKNLDDLLTVLKGKDDIELFSQKSGLPGKYLEVLKRVVNGYRQKPNRIKDFPCIAEETAVKLERIGIRNTLKLYEMILTPDKRDELAEETGISKSEIVTLAKLTDLSRIRWVNHTFAYVLLEAGYESAEEVAHADPEELYEKIKRLNSERKIYNAHIGVRDMKMCIDSAGELDFEIEM